MQVEDTIDKENSDPAANQVQIVERLPAASIDPSHLLSIFDAQLAKLKSEWRGKYNGNPAKEKLSNEYMDQTILALKHQLYQDFEPIDYSAFEQRLNDFQSSRLVLEDSDEDESISSSSSSEVEEADISFDDSEILDMEAYNKVRELRSKTREIAANIITTREASLEKALGVTDRSVQELIKLHGFDETQEEGTDTNERVEADNNKSDNRMNQLNTSLQNLSTSLQTINPTLTAKLTSLRETINTIDCAVDKYQKVSQGDENALSQTDKAIIAAANARPRREVVEEDSVDDGDGELARLLAGIW